jgi:hypothetical protein
VEYGMAFFGSCIFRNSHFIIIKDLF